MDAGVLCDQFANGGYDAYRERWALNRSIRVVNGAKLKGTAEEYFQVVRYCHQYGELDNVLWVALENANLGDHGHELLGMAKETAQLDLEGNTEKLLGAALQHVPTGLACEWLNDQLTQAASQNKKWYCRLLMGFGADPRWNTGKALQRAAYYSHFELLDELDRYSKKLRSDERKRARATGLAAR